jgi:hypothetical protein
MRRSRDSRPVAGRKRRPPLLAAVGIFMILAIAGMGLAMGKRSPSSTARSAPVVAAAGDIACDPLYPTFNKGNGTATECHEKATARLVEQIKPIKVLALGDIQYIRGTPEKYAFSYDPTWGRFKNVTFPSIGNHEGGEGGTNKAYFNYFGNRAGDRLQGYYSYDIGKWHIVSLNSNCGLYSFIPRCALWPISTFPVSPVERYTIVTPEIRR